jgi:proteasome beta subunit
LAAQYSIPGATTIGVVCKDGVILASEKRVSYGYMVMSKTGKKVFEISNKIGAACAGFVADMQILIRIMQANAQLFELEHGREMEVKATAKLMSNMLFQRRLFPFLTQTIVGGVDEKGSSIFVLDPLGSLIPDDYAVVGSGAEIAVGVLEAHYNNELSVVEGKTLVKKAVRAAIARDIASGNGMDILTITDQGIKEETISF